MINVTNLMNELEAAGIECGGCNSKGIVWDVDGLTEIQDRKDVKAVIAKHDPTPEPEETLDEKIERIVSAKISKRG